jgi:hypothetical protein
VKPRQDAEKTFWNEIDERYWREIGKLKAYEADPDANAFGKHLTFIVVEAEMTDMARRALAADAESPDSEPSSWVAPVLKLVPLLGDDDQFPLWTRAIVRAIRERYPDLANYTPEPNGAQPEPQ